MKYVLSTRAVSAISQWIFLSSCVICLNSEPVEAASVNPISTLTWCCVYKVLKSPVFLQLHCLGMLLLDPLWRHVWACKLNKLKHSQTVIRESALFTCQLLSPALMLRMHELYQFRPLPRLSLETLCNIAQIRAHSIVLDHFSIHLLFLNLGRFLRHQNKTSPTQKDLCFKRRWTF